MKLHPSLQQNITELQLSHRCSQPTEEKNVNRICYSQVPWDIWRWKDKGDEVGAPFAEKADTVNAANALRISNCQIKEFIRWGGILLQTFDEVMTVLHYGGILESLIQAIFIDDGSKEAEILFRESSRAWVLPWNRYRRDETVEVVKDFSCRISLDVICVGSIWSSEVRYPSRNRLFGG